MFQGGKEGRWVGSPVALTGYIFTTDGVACDTTACCVLMTKREKRKCDKETKLVSEYWKVRVFKVRHRKGKNGERKRKLKISEYPTESFTPFAYRYSDGRLGLFLAAEYT